LIDYQFVFEDSKIFFKVQLNKCGDLNII